MSAIKVIIYNNVFTGPRGAAGWHLEKTFEVAVCPRKGEFVGGIGIERLVVTEVGHNLRDGFVEIVVGQTSLIDDADPPCCFFDNKILNQLREADPTWRKCQ